MQTRALKTLVEIDKVGSFATAAVRLNMTLSAVSMQMKALESDLGAALFDRSSRPPRLTPLGRAVCDRAGRMLAVEAELRAACQPQDRLTGRYRIGFVPTASVRLLPTFLVNAQKLAPDATFEVVTGLSAMLEASIRRGDLEFAVVTASPSPEAGLAYRALREETLAFAAPPEPALRTVGALLAHLPFLHFMPTSGIGKLIAAHMAALGDTERDHLVLDSVEAIMECVNSGIGFTLLPEPDIRRYAAPTVRIFPAGPPHLTRRLALASATTPQRQAQAAVVGELFQTPN